jgi:hypothetical protein
MQQTLPVATVAACASIVAALIACIQAWRVARIAAQATLDVEVARAAQARWTEAFKATTPRAEALSAVMAEAWEILQTAREELRRASSDAAYDQDILKQRLNQFASGLSSMYAKHGAALPEAARSAWHRAKNRLGHIASVLEDAQDAVPARHRQALVQAAVDLADAQAMLANEQHRLFAALVAEVGGVRS